MLAMNLVDNLDSTINYGILLCNNESVTEELIQDKIHEIREGLDTDGEEWNVDDIIHFFPKDCFVFLQKQNKKLKI